MPNQKIVNDFTRLEYFYIINAVKNNKGNVFHSLVHTQETTPKDHRLYSTHGGQMHRHSQEPPTDESKTRRKNLHRLQHAAVD